MRNKLTKTMYIFVLIIAILLQYSLTTFASTDNEKCAWGFCRGTDHAQPRLDSKPLKILEKYGGIAMGNSDSKQIYLTFDSGYEGGYTENILATLKKNNVPATFFITAHYLNTAEELVMQMIKDGHAVGNHTVNHKDITAISEEELKKEVMDLHIAVQEKTGYEMKYFRPPKGEFNDSSIAFLKNLGYTSVLWSNAYDDWNTANQGRSDYGKKKLLDNLHNGCVLLIHSTSEDNMVLLDDFIKEARAMGYTFASLDNFE